MAASDNIIPFAGVREAAATVVLKDEFRGTVNACRQLVLQQLPRRMDILFRQLDETLYSLAEQAGNDLQQTLYFDALRELRLQWDVLESQFNQQLLAGYDRFWRHGPEEGVTSCGGGLPVDGFSLLEQGALEEELAVSGMVSRGESRFYRELYALDRRFGYLLNGLDLSGKATPLSPSSVCNIFRQVISQLTVDLQIRLVIYKQFEPAVLERLDALYDQINTTLANAGVLSQLKLGIRPAAAAPLPGSSVPVTSDAPVVEQGPSEPGESVLPRELFNTFQQLLGQRRKAVGEEGNSSAKQWWPVVDTGDLLSALSALQHAAPFVDEVKGDLLQILAIEGDGKTGKKIERADEDVLDIISMLFEFILEDPALDDAMRALLARLQIPMLKVAIVDKTFFSKKEHPARRLLNTLARAAVGWSNEAGRKKGGLYGEIESIVTRILSEFSDDLSLFETLNEQFDDFTKRQQRGVATAERRAAQVSEGREQLLQVRKGVRVAIGRALAGRNEVPAVAMTLIEDGWSDRLQLISLRQGEASDAWQSAVGLMERLLWSVEPKPERAQQQALLEAIPQLLRGLRSGLGEISYDQHKMNRLFKELQLCHVNCLRGKTPPVKKVDVAAKRGLGASFAGDQAGAEGAAAAVVTDRFDQLAAEIEVGSWLTLSDSTGGSRRLKLSWRSQATGHCLFVNHRGIKAEELPVTEVASWFRDGRAAVIEDVGTPLMERALEAMLNTLEHRGEDSVPRVSAL